MITSWSKEKRKLIARNILFLSNAFLNDSTGCWLWDGAADKFGRGKSTKLGNSSKPDTAPRVSWERFVGPIPKGMHVLHKCDVPACINPDHLFLGTHADNMNDRVSKGRYKKRSWSKCHPNRLHKANGLCESCYQMSWREKNVKDNPQTT